MYGLCVILVQRRQRDVRRRVFNGAASHQRSTAEHDSRARRLLPSTSHGQFQVGLIDVASYGALGHVPPSTSS